MDKLQGSHSDVYALGMIMADLCKPADNQIRNFTRTIYARDGPFRTRIVSAYYSKPLKDLIRRCRAKDGTKRPDAYELYKETKEKMEQYRAKAYAAEEESRSQRYPGYLFHEKVLFTKADQDLFRENSDFRGYFLEANLMPVWEAEQEYERKPPTPAPADPENDEDYISIETDPRSSSRKRLTAPEARVRTGLAEEFITSRAWHLFVDQSLDALVDRFSAPNVRSDSTTMYEISKIESPTPKETFSQPQVASPARASSRPSA